MPILTERLKLRPLTQADEVDLLALHSDPEVMHGSSGRRVPRTRVESQEWLARMLAMPPHPGHGIFRVEDRETGQFLGRCGLRPELALDGTDAATGATELAYAYMRHAWGRGIASEAARAVLRHGLEAGIRHVVADVFVENHASQRVLEKLGMKRISRREHGDGIVWVRYEVFDDA